MVPGKRKELNMFTRGSGILLHLSSLPAPHGIGDMGPIAYTFADMLVAGAQLYWQVLPLNPTHPGSYNSPYFSSSALAGNPLLISLERLCDEGLLTPADIPQETFSECEVDYLKVTSYKLPILLKAYRNFKASGKKFGTFDTFCEQQHYWLHDFALFMVLKKKFNGAQWNEWPDPVKFRNSSALNAIEDEYKEQLECEKWLQYTFFRQWDALKTYCNEKKISIIGDIPIYVSYDSVDVWTNPQLFKLDKQMNPIAVSGVPPDYFSKTGQLWNNPVYNWEMMRKSNYHWWVERMKAMFTRFDIVRIDHFRGLVQYWEVPAGEETAINGSWQPVPTYEFFDKLIKEIPGFPVIAEDLGIITDDVKEAMEHYGFPGMKVLLFAFGEDNPTHPYLPHMYEKNSLVYTGTHDNNTIRGWLEHEAADEDKDRIYRYTGCREHSVGTVGWALIRLAQSSVARCAIIPAQDLLLLGINCRMNQPAIAQDNWQWRLSTTQMAELPLNTLKEMAQCFGRLPDESRQ